MTLTVTATQVDNIRTHLNKPGAVVSLLLTSGSVLTAGQFLSADNARMSFYDFAGDTLVVGIEQVEAYILGAQAPGNATEAPETGEDLTLGTDDALAPWRIALLELRAACDESTDPKVKEAVANLEAIELALEDELEEGEQAPATS